MKKFGLRAASIFLAAVFATAGLAQAPAVPAAGARKEITVPHATLARYVGTYELGPQMKMSVVLEGEQLQAQLSGQQKYPLFAESETKFFWKVVDAQFDFKLDAKGAVAGGVLHQSGVDIDATRTSSKVAEHKEVKLAADVLASYAGAYITSTTPPVTFVVTVENSGLTILANAQQKFEFFAEAKDKFFLKVADAQIEFVREADKIKAMVLQPGNVRAERQEAKDEKAAAQKP